MTTQTKQETTVRIYDHLLFGKENAMTADELANALGFCGRWKNRDVTRQIERERKSGLPICATCSAQYRGYYRPASDAEYLEYIHQFEHRHAEMGKTLTALKNSRFRYDNNVN